MKAKIICDASLDDNYGIAGYAGSVSFNDISVKDHYEGSLSGMRTSNETEMHAIYEGIKVAIKHSTEDNPLKAINVYSDSMNSINRIGSKKKLKKSEIEVRLLKKIRALTDEHGLKLYCHHVKAHQPNAIATPLQKKHNAIDKKAYRAMVELRNSLTKVRKYNKQSSKYGVIVDSDPSPKMAKCYEKLAYELASNGMSARVVMQGGYKDPSTHPYFIGIQKYAIEAGLSKASLVSQVHWKDTEVSDYADRVFGCQGMDKCMFTYHSKNEKLKINEKSKEANMAGAASRLIYGYQSKTKSSMPEKSKHGEEPSRFILDVSMTDKKSFDVSDWAKKITDTLGMKHFKNIKEIQRDKEVNLLNNGLAEELKENNQSMAM